MAQTTERTEGTTPATPTKTWSTKRTGFKVTDKGALYLEFTTARVYALRPDPARCWTADLGARPRWCSLKEPPLEPGSRSRELRLVNGTAAKDAAKDKEAVHAAQSHSPYFVRRRDNVQKLLAHVPVAVQDVLARVGAGSWGLYRFLHRSPAALELCATDEGLRVAYLLAHAHRLLGADVVDDDGVVSEVVTPAQRRSLAVARALLPKKRKDIVGRFGLPPTKATLKALGRIPAMQLSPRLLVDVRAVLADEYRRRRVAHLPVAPPAVWKLLRSPWWLQLDPVLLHDVAAASAGDDGIVDDDGPARLLSHTVQLAQQLGQPVPYFDTWAKLVAIHDELTVEARQWLQTAKVPLPPLPDVLTSDERLWVDPLPTLQAMVQEGATMHHCLGTLADQRVRAQHGRFFAFALHWPCRLTLAVVSDVDTPWQIYDLRGFANSEAPGNAWAWARAFVERWNRRFPVGLRDDPTAPTQLTLFEGIAPGVRFDLLHLLEDGAPF
jgi:hypothetical protein